MALDDHRSVGLTFDVARHHDPAASVLSQYLVGTFGFLDFGELARRNPSRRRRNQKIAKALRRPKMIWEPYHYVEAAIAVDHSRHHSPTRQLAEPINQSARLHPVERGTPVIDSYLDLWNLDLLLHLKIGEARNA